MDGWNQGHGLQARGGLCSQTPLPQVMGREGNDPSEKMVTLALALVAPDLGGGGHYPSLLLISNQFLYLERSQNWIPLVSGH